MAVQVARAGKLLDLYGASVMTDAVAEILARGLDDPSSLAVACDRHRRALQKPMPLTVPLPDHVDDREVIPHSLEKYGE